MSTADWQERRRHPRVEPNSTVRLSMPVVHDVKVLDVSRSGLLFSTGASLAVGQRAQIRTVIDRQPFAATVEVVRVDRSAGADGRCFAGRFSALDEANRARLDAFLAT
jgi:hypothetical protein